MHLSCSGLLEPPGEGIGAVDDVYACDCARVSASRAVELALCLVAASCFKEAATYVCTCTPAPRLFYYFDVLCVLLLVERGPAIFSFLGYQPGTLRPCSRHVFLSHSHSVLNVCCFCSFDHFSPPPPLFFFFEGSCGCQLLPCTDCVRCAQ